MHPFREVCHPPYERGPVNVLGAPVEVTVACCLCVRPESHQEPLPQQSLLKDCDNERESREQNKTY